MGLKDYLHLLFSPEVGKCPKSADGEHDWDCDGFDTKQCRACHVRINDDGITREVVYPKGTPGTTTTKDPT